MDREAIEKEVHIVVACDVAVAVEIDVWALRIEDHGIPADGVINVQPVALDPDIRVRGAILTCLGICGPAETWKSRSLTSPV